MRRKTGLPAFPHPALAQATTRRRPPGRRLFFVPLYGPLALIKRCYTASLAAESLRLLKFASAKWNIGKFGAAAARLGAERPPFFPARPLSSKSAGSAERRPHRHGARRRHPAAQAGHLRGESVEDRVNARSDLGTNNCRLFIAARAWNDGAGFSRRRFFLLRIVRLGEASRAAAGSARRRSSAPSKRRHLPRKIRCAGVTRARFTIRHEACRSRRMAPNSSNGLYTATGLALRFVAARPRRISRRRGSRPRSPTPPPPASVLFDKSAAARRKSSGSASGQGARANTSASSPPRRPARTRPLLGFAEAWLRHARRRNSAASKVSDAHFRSDGRHVSASLKGLRRPRSAGAARRNFHQLGRRAR